RNGKAFAERMTIGVIKILSVFHQIAFTELKLLHFGFGVALQKGDSSIAALVVINHPFEKRGVFRGFYGQPDTASAGNRRGSAGSIYFLIKVIVTRQDVNFPAIDVKFGFKRHNKNGIYLSL